MLLTDITTTVEPQVEPITIKELKDYLKLDYTTDDAMLTALICTARQWAEKYTSRAFICRTLKAHFENHNEKVRLPYPPINSVTTVTRVRDNESSALTLNTDYYVNGVADKYLTLTSLSTSNVTPGISPRDNLRAWNLEVTFIAGYGYSREDVPSGIRHGVLRLAAYLYENRDEVEVGTIVAKIPFGIRAMLDAYKIISI
jgi:uncharacterized phiE125 gp8 family phage protein